MPSLIRGAMFALFVLAVSLGYSIPASSQTALAQKSAEADEIATIAQRHGSVRIIVMFQRPAPASQMSLDNAASVAAVRSQVGAAQDTIITRHFASAASPAAGQGFQRGISRFPLTPGFAVNVSPAELQSLASDPQVTSINYDRAVPPSLVQSVPLIGMTNAYSLGVIGSGQVVAVLDTGVQSNHNFLTGKVVAEACFSNSGGGGGAISLCPNNASSQTGAGAANAETPQCINGSTALCTHGTHVAGIAAGAQASGSPSNGVAKDAKIFAIQIFSRFNSPMACSPFAPPCVLTFTSDQIFALDHVAANITIGSDKVAAVNMSLGGGLFPGNCDSASQKPSIDTLRNAGVLTAIAAGNNGSTSQMSSPACISSALSVASATKSDGISSFSNISSVTKVIAPGTSILSSIVSVPHSNSGFAFFDGTSMATPHVAGAIAAIRSVCPTATASQIESGLISTGTPITDTRPGGTITKNRIRVDLAAQQICGAGKAMMSSPAPGSTLAGTSETFSWTAGTGVTQYWLYVGTTGVGSNNIFNQSTGTTQQATVNNLPGGSVTLYVRLYSQISGVWQFNDYTYTSFAGTKAVLTTPTPGSTLQSTSASFGWNAGIGASEYWLTVGTHGVGSKDVFDQSVGTSLSGNVTGIPLTGGYLYVRLWTKLGSSWQFNDYQYFTTSTIAEMTSPSQGSTFTGTSVTFQWTAGTGIIQYWLDVGTTGVGSTDLLTQSTGTSTSRLVNGLPLNGARLYVRLWSRVASSTWLYNDYAYTAASGQAATITSPSPNATLAGATQSFNWTTGIGATAYWLYVGTTGPGSLDIYAQPTATTAATVGGLPTNGTTLYVRLWSLVAGSWQFNDYLYRASGTPQCAVASSPAPGSTLGASETFIWSAVAGATQYWITAGSNGVGSSNIVNQSTGTATSRTVANLPANGNPVFVRLWALVSGNWCFSDQSYSTQQGIAASITSPTPNGTLGGTSEAFAWNNGVAVGAYSLYVGTEGPGSANLYNQNFAAGVNGTTVSGLPSDGRTIYVRLWSLISGIWQSRDYLYRATGSGAAAEITSPTPGSSLNATTTTFQWSQGSGVSEYWVYAGTSVGAGDIYNASTGLTRQVTVSGIPHDGRPVYVRLWSLIGGNWQSRDYAFGTGVLLTGDLSEWQSQAPTFGNVATGYGTTSTPLGAGSVAYPSATIDTVGAGWSTWCCGYTGNVAYFSGSSSVTITLSGVAAFGFQMEPSAVAVQNMSVTLSSGQSISANVNGHHGAQFVGFVGKNVTSVTITNNSGFDFAIGNFYYLPDAGGAASMVVASAERNLALGATPSRVAATATCTTQACNTVSAGNR